MGLLDQLWDDTLAGPRPDSGLGKLRKQPTFSSRSTSGKESNAESAKSYEEGASSEETIRVSRRIMIVKPPGYQYGSPPVSAAGSATPPQSPFSENHFGSEEDRHRMLMRRQAKSDLGLLLLLMTCEI
ncbi:dormancy-associated protein homolog 3-like isoform X1 [Momordica charantia]|uniref:Dormancy-associated protein homolog 3-like isoform X1 n=1 Tax=Momordica charantia TaxID=3673 RepID=A0A6J1CX63_MOMCH|nr:dormancy-associated protein homolog 3-like isoform X1 [Momordica charantia]